MADRITDEREAPQDHVGPHHGTNDPHKDGGEDGPDEEPVAKGSGQQLHRPSSAYLVEVRLALVRLVVVMGVVEQDRDPPRIKGARRRSGARTSGSRTSADGP